MNIFDPTECDDREFYTKMLATFKRKALEAIAADQFYDAKRYLNVAEKCLQCLQGLDQGERQ